MSGILIFLVLLRNKLSNRGQQTDFAHLFEKLQMHCTLQKLPHTGRLVIKKQVLTETHSTLLGKHYI